MAITSGLAESPNLSRPLPYLKVQSSKPRSKAMRRKMRRKGKILTILNKSRDIIKNLLKTFHSNKAGFNACFYNYFKIGQTLIFTALARSGLMWQSPNGKINGEFVGLSFLIKDVIFQRVCQKIFFNTAFMLEI